MKCSKCILPDSYPGIEFDNDGVCNYCHRHEKDEPRGAAELSKFVDSVPKGKGEYDCVVGISGGRDSAYVLYYCAKVLKLRTLAYTTNNQYVPPIAFENMRSMTSKLGVDLYEETHDFLKKTLRNNVAAWIRRPSPAMITLFCTGCNPSIHLGLLSCAKKHGIPMAFLGTSSTFESCHFRKEYFASNKWGRAFKKLRPLSLLFGLFYEIGKNPFYFLNPRLWLIYAREFMGFFFLQQIRSLVYPRQKLVYFFDYVGWDEKTIVDTITKELDWKTSKGSASSWRFDCLLSFLKEYLFRECAGFTEKVDGLSVQIREDRVTRQEALQRAINENQVPMQYIEELMEKLDLSVEDLQDTLRRVKISHPLKACQFAEPDMPPADR